MRSAPFDVMMPWMCTPLGELDGSKILRRTKVGTRPLSVCLARRAQKKEFGDVHTYLQNSFYFHEACVESLSRFLPNLRAVSVLQTMGRRQTLY